MLNIICQNLNTGNCIQLWLAIGTGILSIVSVASIIIVLFQNKQIIENSKRPYIMIYKDLISNTTPIEYLVIKNSGNTTANITSIEYNEQDIQKLNKDYSMLENALKSLNNSYIAPNQSYKIPLKTKDVDIKFLDLKVFYKSGKKSYSDNFIINLKQDYPIAKLKQHTTQYNKDRNIEYLLKDISETLQELVNRIN